MRIDFRTRLERSPLLFDGGVGTTLYERGVLAERLFRSPEPVRCGGASAPFTKPSWRRAPRRSRRTPSAPIRSSWRRTVWRRRAGRSTSPVRGSPARRRARIATWPARSGPLGVRTAPLGRLDPERAKDLFLVQARALAEGGVDCFLCETFIYVEELALAVRACREAAPDLTVIAQATLAEHGGSLTGGAGGGTDPGTAPHRRRRGGGELLRRAPTPCCEWLERAAPLAAGVPLSVMPNAGRPRGVDGRNIYLSTPEYLAAYTGRFLEAGARIVGGCCGVSPPPPEGDVPRLPRRDSPREGDPRPAEGLGAVAGGGAGSPWRRRAVSPRGSPPGSSSRWWRWSLRVASPPSGRSRRRGSCAPSESTRSISPTGRARWRG